MVRTTATRSTQSNTTDHANTVQTPTRRSARLIKLEVGELSSRCDAVSVIEVGGPIVFKGGKAKAQAVAAEQQQHNISFNIAGADGTMVKSTDVKMQVQAPATSNEPVPKAANTMAGDKGANSKATKTTKSTRQTPNNRTGGKGAFYKSTKTKSASPPKWARRNTRSKAVQDDGLTASDAPDEDDIEEIPSIPEFPRYKDDLPNAFNGEVDPQKNFIGNAPLEVIDNILSFLVEDHYPDIGVQEQKTGPKRRPHVLLSLAAMSKSFYHATESFAERFLARNMQIIDPLRKERLEAIKNVENRRRRSARLAKKPQAFKPEIFRTELLGQLRFRCAVCLGAVGSCPGKLSNAVSICHGCEHAEHGRLLSLTDALKSYDLRDYMIMKSRTPGPRAKFTDLPEIPHGSEFKALGFPVFKRKTVYFFRERDVEMIAGLVHGDVVEHMQQKEEARELRRQKSQAKRVREHKIKYHQEQLEITTGKIASCHSKRMVELLALDPSDEEDAHNMYGCNDHFCYHNIGLCRYCGDVPGGRKDEGCHFCWGVFMDKRYDQYYAALLNNSPPQS